MNICQCLTFIACLLATGLVQIFEVSPFFIFSYLFPVENEDDFIYFPSALLFHIFQCLLILVQVIQCDQMAKLSFQYWAINNNENLSNIIKTCPIRQFQNFAQYKIHPQRIDKDFESFAKEANFRQIWSHWNGGRKRERMIILALPNIVLCQSSDISR